MLDFTIFHNGRAYVLEDNPPHMTPMRMYFDTEAKAIDAAVRIAQELKALYRITYIGSAFAGQRHVVACSSANGLDL